MNLERFVEAAGPLRALNVTVLKDGREIARHEWEPVFRRNIYSASKSFTSCAVGIAQAEGLLSLDEKLTDAFAAELPDTVSDNLAKATVRDLLTMCLGQQQAWLMAAQRVQVEEDDWVKVALSYPFVDEPGTKFVYNNVGPYLAGVLVQKRAGCDLVNYLMPRLFGPLGIKRPTWEVDPLGRTFGAAGLMLTVDELAKFGQLYLQEGSWNGRQLVPSEWVRRSLSVHADNGAYGYGYQFWAGPCGSFRADGMYGQFSFIMRDKNAVVAIASESRETARLIDAVFEHIHPQL